MLKLYRKSNRDPSCLYSSDLNKQPMALITTLLLYPLTLH